jgi:hypothetical protein
MPANEVDLEPSELEALQAEEDTAQPAVNVRHEGPLRVQVLPRKNAGTRLRNLTTAPILIVSADHRRASVTIVSPAAIVFAFTAAAAQDLTTMAAWPANVPYTLTADSALYVAAATGTTTLSVITEFWATGE